MSEQAQKVVDPQESKPRGEATPDAGNVFSQADLDRMIKERVARERAKFADYEALKNQAEAAKTADQRIAELENKLRMSETRELRRTLVERIARENGIVDPDDISLFLTGDDEESLTAQARRLAAKTVEKKAVNLVPLEGTQKGAAPSDARQLSARLFGSR